MFSLTTVECCRRVFNLLAMALTQDSQTGTFTPKSSTASTSRTLKLCTIPASCIRGADYNSQCWIVFFSLKSHFPLMNMDIIPYVLIELWIPWSIGKPWLPCNNWLWIKNYTRESCIAPSKYTLWLRILKHWREQFKIDREVNPAMSSWVTFSRYYSDSPCENTSVKWT